MVYDPGPHSEAVWVHPVKGGSVSPGIAMKYRARYIASARISHCLLFPLLDFPINSKVRCLPSPFLHQSTRTVHRFAASYSLIRHGIPRIRRYTRIFAPSTRTTIGAAGKNPLSGVSLQQPTVLG